MEDKLHSFFTENDFDIHEPHTGHLNRFERKLNQPKKQSFSWAWMSAAASVILIIGFYLGSFQQQKTYDLADISPKMAETQSFFVNTINQELKEVEKFRTIDTEIIIEDTLEELEELEDQYKSLVYELNHQDNKRQVIKGMIQNYQQRLSLLENLLEHLEQYKNPTQFNIENDEVI